MKKRGAVIGVGYLGNFHAQKYKKLCAEKFNDSIDFVGVCDLNFDQAKKVAAELQVKPFANPMDLIGQVDLVSIATITPTHYELAKAFLAAGIHVNVEKPIAVRAIEARELVAIAKEKNLILAVGHSERFNPAFVALQKKVKNPRYMELLRHAPFKPRGSDVSVMHDLMIHDIDLMLQLDTSEPQLDWAKAGRGVTHQYDWATAGFLFQSGMRAMISVSRLAEQMTRTTEVWMDHGKVKADLQVGHVVSTEFSKGEPYTVFTKTETGRGDSLLTETDLFFESVLFNKSKTVSGEDGLAALAWVEAIEQKLSHD